MYYVFIVKIRNQKNRRKLTKDMRYIDKKYGLGETKDNKPVKGQQGGKENKKLSKMDKNFLEKKDKREFLYNPDNPSKSFDVYIDKDLLIQYLLNIRPLKMLKILSRNLKRLYKNGEYMHKRIWQVGMIMYVRLKVLKDKKPKEFKLQKDILNILEKD